MVATKTTDSDHDFENDPLDLFVDGDLIGAKNTTLGGDDGIAVALCYGNSCQHRYPASTDRGCIYS